ncbi:MAG TPA: DUF2235 domain-containing protein, partial [Planctomycetaceae bacterium]|nr:DUF2235 domain-containing protein [Planctomycetaceae bacterium]
DNYEAGDRVFLFGFSRGAYTVRCLTGMINHCGLLATGEFESDQVWAAVDAAYDAYLNRRRDPNATWWQDDWEFHLPNDLADTSIPIHFLGVWDTVGALGIPDNLGVANLFDRYDRYAFSDTRLSPNVLHARHAVAIDEQRSNFAATLWNKKWTAKQDVKELWFPGTHGDVGGGWAETALSDGALKWMIDEAKSEGLAINPVMESQISPDPQGLLHESSTGVMKHLTPVPRAVPPIDESTHFHQSSIVRNAAPPITQAPYWPTRRLKSVGDSLSVSVYARQPWNATGLWVDEKHAYDLSASGRWLDKNVSCGPGGTHDGDFQLGELAHLASSLLGQAEGLLQRASGNEEIDIRGTRRHEEYPWFCLVGAVANDINPDVSGTPLRHEHRLIGESLKNFQPRKSGYLYAYANDAWHFYSNNRGSVVLTVKRVA